MPELTFYAARAHWLEHLARDRRLAKSTLGTYATVLRMAFEGLQDSPTEPELRAAIDRRLNHPSGHIRRHAFVVVSLFLRWWEQHGGPTSLLKEAKPPPRPTSRRSALQPADLAALQLRLLDAPPKDRAEVLLMLKVGFRVGDVVGLKVADIDFDGSRLHCRSGKGGTDTWLPMAASVAVALQEHLADADITEGWVFVGPRGPMRTQGIWKAFKRVAGPELAQFTPHQLRNTFATQMVRNGTPINSVRRLMRHASLVTTQRYLDDDEDAEREAVRGLDGLPPSEPRVRVLAALAEPPATPVPPRRQPRGRESWSAAQIEQALRPAFGRYLGECDTPDGPVEGWDGLLDWLEGIIRRWPELADVVRPKPFVYRDAEFEKAEIPAYTYRGLRDAIRAGLVNPPTIDPPDWYGAVEAD